MKTYLVFLLLFATLLLGRAARKSPRAAAEPGASLRRTLGVATVSANQKVQLQRK